MTTEGKSHIYTFQLLTLLINVNNEFLGIHAYFDFTSVTSQVNNLSITDDQSSLCSHSGVVLRDASYGWLLSALQAAGAGCTCAGPTGT